MEAMPHTVIGRADYRHPAHHHASRIRQQIGQNTGSPRGIPVLIPDAFLLRLVDAFSLRR
jgi:hypothetical protein